MNASFIRACEGGKEVLMKGQPTKIWPMSGEFEEGRGNVTVVPETEIYD